MAKHLTRQALTSDSLAGNVCVVHLELSVSEPNATRARESMRSRFQAWIEMIDSADDPCLILDTEAVVVAISEPLRRLLGLDAAPIGRDLLDGVLRPLDFADGGTLTDVELNKIPPLLALTSGRLARGLLRLAGVSGSYTLDAIATPLTEGGAIVGSLTFFSRV